MIGDFDRRVRLLQKQRTADDGGGFAESWQAAATVWAALSAASGGESYGPDAAEAAVKYRIRIRRRSDVAAGWRVETGDRLFAVYAVEDPGPRAFFVTLLCEEIP
jgi:SPP1 family predicted phage head-tail adaptor